VSHQKENIMSEKKEPPVIIGPDGPHPIKK